MSFFSLLRSASIATIVLTSTALSCQDHHIPDPDPVSNCTRINGTPRAVDCEFEIVEVAFYRGSVSDANLYGKVTPNDSNLVIKEQFKYEFVAGSASSLFSIGLIAKITVKRIAPAPAGSNKYLFRSTIQSFKDPRFPEREVDSRFGFLLDEDNYDQVAIDVPVGGTFTYNDMMAGFQGQYTTDRTTGLIVYPVNPTWVIVQNVETSKKLRNVPYSYTLFRDQAEARLKFVPKVIASRV